VLPQNGQDPMVKCAVGLEQRHQLRGVKMHGY
jgi:hypothetical protein